MDEDIIDLHYNKKWNMQQISKKYGFYDRTISKRLISLGYKIINYNNITTYNESDVIKLLESGMSYVDIGKLYGISPYPICKIAKRHNIKYKRFNDAVFDSIDNEEKAYWLGFIFADGYISKKNNKFELSLKGDDFNHLCKFSKFINFDENKISKRIVRCNDKKYECCRISFSNKHFWEILNSYGCTPRKSLTLKFPDESIFKSKDLIRHFIRGYFDGDGWICCTDKTKCIGALGTPSFLNSCQKYLNTNYNLYRNHGSDLTMKLVATRYSGLKIAEYLYSNSEIYLERKYLKYLKLKSAVLNSNI